MKRLEKQFVLMVLVVMALQIMVIRVAAAASPGDVVINEISWAGSADGSSDEWIELYNNTNQVVDISGWYIEDDAIGVYNIASGMIAPHGYFLIEDSEEVTNVPADAVVALSLANSGDSLVLKDQNDSIIDTVNGTGGSWFGGNSTTKATMERIDPEVTTDNADNWSSAIFGNGSLGRAGSEILGTPRTVNSTYAGSGPGISLNVSNLSPQNGDTIVVSVDVAAVSDLYAYGMEINYDPAVLNFVSASEGDVLNGDGASTSFNAVLEDGSEGVLIIGNSRLVNPVAGVDGSGTLFDITFIVVANVGASTGINFGPDSYVADSVGDIPASFDAQTISVTDGVVNPVGNLTVDLGSQRYSLELTWDLPVGAADSYIVRKRMADGNFAQVANVTELNYIDNDQLVPGVSYEYEIIAVKNGINSATATANGLETRGIKGDNDRSDRVDGRDLEKLARAYGSVLGDSEYDALLDTTYDGVIDGSDLIDIGVNFGLNY